MFQLQLTLVAPQIKELLNAIPAHCFKRSLFKSSAYVVWDFCLVALFAYAASHINTFFDHDGLLLNGLPGQVAKAAAWATFCKAILCHHAPNGF